MSRIVSRPDACPPYGPSIDGTHHYLSKEHPGRDLAQFDFLYSLCKVTDSARRLRARPWWLGKAALPGSQMRRSPRA